MIMKYLFQVLGLFILSILIASCSSSTLKSSLKMKEKPVVIANDSLEYEIIIFDIGFTLYLNSVARPMNYYSQNYFGDAIYELERFIKTYPHNPRMDYAHFLLAMCYYESIVDEKKDLMPLLKAQKKFKFIVKDESGLFEIIRLGVICKIKVSISSTSSAS